MKIVQKILFAFQNWFRTNENCSEKAGINLVLTCFRIVLTSSNKVTMFFHDTKY